MITQKNNINNHLRYASPPDPFTTISMKADKINYILKRGEEGNRLVLKPGYGGLGQIKSGEWDQKNNRIDVFESKSIKFFTEVFSNGKKVEETEYYEYVRDKFEQEIYYNRGYQSSNEFLEDYFNEYIKLYMAIKREGYRTNHKGNRKVPGATQGVDDLLEILVVIDRDGNICFYEGHHRFGIALALGLEIPVHILCRHEQWQELRDEIYKNGLDKKHNQMLQNHPDLRDVLY